VSPLRELSPCGRRVYFNKTNVLAKHVLAKYEVYLGVRSVVLATYCRYCVLVVYSGAFLKTLHYTLLALAVLQPSHLHSYACVVHSYHEWPGVARSGPEWRHSRAPAEANPKNNELRWVHVTDTGGTDSLVR